MMSSVVDELKACRELNPVDMAKAVFDIIDANFKISQTTDVTKLPVNCEYRKYIKNGGVYDLKKIRSNLGKAFGRLGQGAFSSVYRISKEYVIKVNDADWNYSPRDAWLDWAVTMVDNQDNPFLVKMQSIEKRKTLFVAVIERLKSSEDVSPGSFPLEAFAKASLKSSFDLSKEIMKIKSKSLAQMVARDHRNAIQMAQLIWKAKKKTNGRLDCHSGNTMVRKNGWPVMTDPIASSTNGMVGKRRNYSWKREAA